MERGFIVVLRLLKRRFGEDQSRLRELAKVLISAGTVLASGVFFESIWLIAVVNIHGWVLEDLPVRMVMFTAWLLLALPGLKYWYIRSNWLLAASTLLFTAFMLFWIAIGFPQVYMFEEGVEREAVWLINSTVKLFATVIFVSLFVDPASLKFSRLRLPFK